MAKNPRTYLPLAMIVLIGHQLFYCRELGYDAVDDAYISFRYAQNFIHGHGLVFNVGERVEGYTNFLWTILIGAFMKVGADPRLVSIVLGALFGLGTLWLVYRFVQLTSPQNSWMAVIAALFLAVDGSFAIWSVSGMETAMFAFLVIAGAVAYLWEQGEDKPAFLSGALFALSTMARPEGGLFFAVTLLHQAIHRLFTKRKLLDWADVVRVGSFLLLYGPYFLWRYLYYGFLLPNTFYAKVATQGIEAQRERGLRYLDTFIQVHLGYPFLVLPVIPLLKKKASFWFTYLLSLILPCVLYIVYVGGDWSVGRFFAPILAPFYILATAGGWELYATVEGWLNRTWPAIREAALGLRTAGTILLLALAIALFNSSSLRGEHELFIRRFDAKLATQARVTLGQWLQRNVPSDTLIAVDAAGQIPFYSGLPTIDMFGVTDLHTAHMEVESMGEGVPGHEKLDLNYVLGRKPAYVIVYGNLLDGSEAYQRVDPPWTEDAALRRFLSIYRRQE